MNKYVKELVEYYFHNEKKLYENNYRHLRGNFNWSYERRLQYQYNDDDDMLNIINEEYHISDVFDEVIDVIEDIYKDNIIENKSKVDELSKKIEQLTNKVNNEKQFNKKVELNLELQRLKKEMEELKNE